MYPRCGKRAEYDEECAGRDSEREHHVLTGGAVEIRDERSAR